MLRVMLWFLVCLCRLLNELIRFYGMCSVMEGVRVV